MKKPSPLCYLHWQAPISFTGWGFSLRSAYMLEKKYQYTHGFNLVTLSAFSLGVACYFMLFDPVHYVANSPLFFYATATGASFIVAALSYYGLSKIPFCRRYLHLEET